MRLKLRLGGLIMWIPGGLFFYLLRIAGAVYFSQVAYLVTLFGVGFGMLLFGERHPGSAWLALLLIFAGLALVNRRQG